MATKQPIKQSFTIKLSKPIISTGAGIALFGLSLFTVLPPTPDKQSNQCTVAINGGVVCQPSYYERKDDTTLLTVWRFGFALVSFMAGAIMLAVEFSTWRDK